MKMICFLFYVFVGECAFIHTHTRTHAHTHTLTHIQHTLTRMHYQTHRHTHKHKQTCEHKHSDTSTVTHRIPVYCFRKKIKARMCHQPHKAAVSSRQEQIEQEKMVVCVRTHNNTGSSSRLCYPSHPDIGT